MPTERGGSAADALIAGAVARHDELLEQHGDAVAAAITAPLQGLDHDSTPLLRPIFVTRPTVEQVDHATRVLLRAVAAATERLVQDRALRRQIGYPAYLDEILDIDREHGVFPFAGRFDGLWDGSTVRFVEFNPRPGLYQWQWDMFEAYTGTPLARELGRQFAFTPVHYRPEPGVAAAQRLAGGQARPPVAVVRHRGADPYLHGDDIFRHLAREGFEVQWGPPESLSHEDGALRRGGVTFSLVDVMIEDLIDPDGRGEAVRAALHGGAATAVLGISRYLICYYKHLLELLSDPQHHGMFDAGTRAALARHIPWTRVVRERRTVLPDGTEDELVPFVREQREQLVLKASSGTHGGQVVLGWNTDRETWDRTLRQALRRAFVVQQRAGAPRETFPVLLDGRPARRSLVWDISPHVWNDDQLGGFIARPSPTGLTAFGAGRCIAPVWVIEGRR